MKYQSKHIELNSHQPLKCMTSGLALKCVDGIVLASDSQGTESDRLKRTIDKVFQIHETAGLVGAKKNHHVKEVVEYLRNVSIKYETEQELTNYLYKHISELHKGKYNPEDTRNDLDLEDDLYFAPEILIGTKLKDNDFHIHKLKFSIEFGKKINRSVSNIYVVSDYDIVGTGSGILLDSLKQLNAILKAKGKKMSELNIEINVGVAMHVINQAKETDLYSGGDTQIGVIDNNGFRKISVENQPTYYYKMVKYLSKLLDMKEDQIKESLPVSIIKLL